MATKKSGDSRANIAAVYCTEAAAGTIAYAKFAFPFSIMDKMALNINRIEYWFSGYGNLNSTADQIVAALVAANSGVTDMTDQANPVILDSARIHRLDYGTAASAMIIEQPFMKDLSTLPGGGILCAPSPLSVAVQSVGASAVCACWVKLFYTYMSLTTDEYWELVESRRIISS